MHLTAKLFVLASALALGCTSVLALPVDSSFAVRDIEYEIEAREVDYLTFEARSGSGATRLAEEHKQWRKSHPFGFYASPQAGGKDLMNWQAAIPGPAHTSWEGGLFRLVMTFPQGYPSKPPKCTFTPPLFHPNIFPSGTVALSMLDEKLWKSATTIPQILLGIQSLLDHPNVNNPAQLDALTMFKNDKAGYERRIKQQAKDNKPM